MSEVMTPEKFESLLLQILFRDKEAQQKVLPYLKPEVFDVFENKDIVNSILSFNEKYDKFPTVHDLKLIIKNKDVYTHLIDNLDKDIAGDYDVQFVKDEVEDFFKNKLFHHELFTALEGLKEGDEEVKSSAPDKLRDAYSFNFNTSIGLDFFDSGEEMFESLHAEDRVIPSGIKNMDKLTKGGFHEKTLSLFMAETNMGKSLVKTALATNFILQNKNVLYLTFEMSEFKVAERIMGNLFDVPLSNLEKMSKDEFMKTLENIKNKVKNKLIIKEFPPRSVNTNVLRSVIKELKLKEKFEPDVILVDYIGIILPNRFSKGNNTNTEQKIISEELRGLAVELGIPIISSVQTNRGGFGDLELDLTDIADSIGVTNTADIIWGISQTEEMSFSGRYMFTLLKNRYGLKNIKTLVGVEYTKMRLFDIEDDGTDNRNINTSKIKHGKIQTPKGTESTKILDETVLQIIKTKTENEKQDRNKLFNIKM